MGKTLSSLSDQQLDRLYQDRPELWEHFCAGAPAVLWNNINPSYGLANGTPVQYVSLTFPQDICLPELLLNDSHSHYTAGQIIDVPGPYAINIQRRNQVDNGYDQHEVMGRLAKSIQKKVYFWFNDHCMLQS